MAITFKEPNRNVTFFRIIKMPRNRIRMEWMLQITCDKNKGNVVSS